MNDRLYYYALYFILAHLGAYVAVLILLITLGMLFTSQTVVLERGRRALLILLPLTALLAGALYSVWRIFSLTVIVHEGLGDAASRRVQSLYPWHELAAAVVAIGVWLWNVFIVCRRETGRLPDDESTRSRSASRNPEERPAADE
jgi:hypothetical protein